MIRFICNFFLFGLIFFLIYRFAPQAFNNLVEIADQGWDFIVEMSGKLVEMVQSKFSGNGVNPQ